MTHQPFGTLRERLLALETGDLRESGELDGVYGLGEGCQLSLRTAPPVAACVRVGLHYELSIPSFTVPPHLQGSPLRGAALASYLARAFFRRFDGLAAGLGLGAVVSSSGVAAGGQKVLATDALALRPDGVEVRFEMSLPSAESAVAAYCLLAEIAPAVMRVIVSSPELHAESVDEFVNLMEDVDALRQAMPGRGVVAFLAEGALLPRLAGRDLPDYARLFPLIGEEGLTMELRVPNAGRVRGVGIPAGLTIVACADERVRREFMLALANGVYNHVPGDGREMVVAHPDSVLVAADPGRAAHGVDIAAFTGRAADRHFSSMDCDASQSQAVAVVEALEVGAKTLLIEESLSSPEFLRGLAAPARRIGDELGVSMVIGLAATDGLFADSADSALTLHDFRLAECPRADRALPTSRVAAGDEETLIPFSRTPRRLRLDSLSPRCDGDTVIGVSADGRFEYGVAAIDLGRLPQVCDRQQAVAIGRALARVHAEGGDEVMDLARLARELPVQARSHEVAALVNRLPGLRLDDAGGGS